MWITIKEPRTNWILARYDPERGLLEFQRRGVKTLVDLRDVEDADTHQNQCRHLTYARKQAYNEVEDTQRAS